MHVLVCDDDEASRYLLTSILTGAGHTCTEAENGVDALEKAHASPPDIIVSDILMPGMDGYALAREWRADEILSTTPFVFYSANYTEPDDERFAQSLGVDRFLIKPMDPISLVREIEGVLDLAERGELHLQMPDVNESDLLREYNARLVSKLETQLSELRSANENLAATAETLRQTEQALSRVIYSSPVAILTLNPEGLVTLWNRAAEKIFGWSADEVLFGECPLLSQGGGQECLNALIGDKKEIAGHVMVVHAKDGRPITVSLAAARMGEDPADGTLAMLTDITAQEETKHDLALTVLKLESVMTGTISAIAKIVEARDPYTSGHQERVAEIAHAIAVEMRLDEDTCDGIRTAALIHDIGKVYVPAEILTKPRRLTEVEFNIVKMHPEVAYDVLGSIDFPWPVATYVLQHHERLDGSGYPNNLTAEEILLGSKILAVADVVEAMSSHRPYKIASGVDAALQEIVNHAGLLYDRDVAEAVTRLFRERGFKLEVTGGLICG